MDPEQAYRLKLVLERLGKQVEFRYYPDEIHGFTNIDDETDFYTRLLAFLKQNIGPQKTVASKKSSLKPRSVDITFEFLHLATVC